MDPSSYATQYWTWLTSTYSEAQIAIGLTFFIHEAVYFSTYLPLFIGDFMPSSSAYKLQPMNCLRRLLFSHFCVELPLMFVAHEAFKVMSMGMSLPLPSCIFWVCIGSFFIEDFYFYWIHRLLHYGPFYKHIHKIHHDHSAPFGMAAEYAHPIEVIFLGLGTVLGPFLLADHVFTMHVWLVVRVIQTIEAHAGFDFPFSPRRLIPFFGGAEYHDFHHETFSGNFASTFIIWDWVFGTDKKYRIRRAKNDNLGKGAGKCIWDYLIYDHIFAVDESELKGN